MIERTLNHVTSIRLDSIATPTDRTNVESSVFIQSEQLSANSVGSRPRKSRRSILVATGLRRALDMLGAAALFVAFLPVTLPITAILCFGKGSIIYRQRRIGLNGQAFRCLKFRTMVPNADEVLNVVLAGNTELKAEWIRDHKLRNDPRITVIGAFLRRTSFDELPQIWNVIRGEMSLVGPRPIVQEELFRYGRGLTAYLSTKPGITGLWQVSGRNNLEYSRRVAIDVYYVRNRNFRLDLYILLKTVRVIFRGHGAY